MIVTQAKTAAAQVSEVEGTLLVIGEATGRRL